MFDGLKEFAELGSTVIVTLAFLFVFYEAQKQKKINGKIQPDRLNEVLGEIRLMNSNHLNSIEKSIRDGNDKITGAINNGNSKIIEKLGEICGKLSK